MSDKFYTKIKPYQWILIICFLGIVLRIYNLEVKGLWMDEIHSTVGTDPDKTIGEVYEYCKQDQPPVFFMLLHWWFKMFSYNDIYGRLLAVLTGMLGILSMYFLGKELKNNRVGLMASFLTMINYFHVDHSRQIRFYPLVFLFSSLSYLFFIRALKRKRPIDFILYSLFTAALLNTHYFGIVVFGTQFILFIVIILWKRITDIKFILYSLLSGVMVGLSFLHWLPVVLSDLEIPQFHAQVLHWYSPFEFYYIYFRDAVTCSICAVLSFLAIREMYFQMKLRSTRIEDVVLLGWVGLGFLIPVLYSVLRMPILEFKYSFIVVPAIIVLVALGFDTLKREMLKTYIIPILFFTFINNALFVRSIYYVPYPPEQWREVTREVIKTDKSNQYVFSEYAWYYRYYFKINKAINQPLEPAFADFDAIISSANSLWVLKSLRFPDRGLSQEQQKKVDLHFALVKEINFTDMNAKHYVKLQKPIE